MITDSSLLFASFQWLCPASGKNVEIQHDWIKDRSFPFFVIMVPEDGVYLAQIENSSSIITVHPGEALVIPPRMVHSVVCPEKCRLNYAYPFFQLQGWFDPFIKRKMPLVFLGSDAVFLKKNITGYSENSAQSLSRAAAIFSFLHERSEANLDPFEDVAHKEDVEKVIVFLEQHYQEKLSRSDQGRLTGLSETRFHYVFKEITGLPPIDYLLKVRMQKAMDLLTLTDMSISEISDACGWNDAVFFSRQFHQKNAMTPLAYRKEQQRKMKIL